VIGEPVLSVGVRGDGANGAMTTATIRATGAATGGNIEAIRPACSLCSAAIANSGWFFRRHQLFRGAPMNPWHSVDGCTGQCWP